MTIETYYLLRLRIWPSDCVIAACMLRPWYFQMKYMVSCDIKAGSKHFRLQQIFSIVS